MIHLKFRSFCRKQFHHNLWKKKKKISMTGELMSVASVPNKTKGDEEGEKEDATNDKDLQVFASLCRRTWSSSRPERMWKP